MMLLYAACSIMSLSGSKRTTPESNPLPKSVALDHSGALSPVENTGVEPTPADVDGAPSDDPASRREPPRPLGTGAYPVKVEAVGSVASQTLTTILFRSNDRLPIFVTLTCRRAAQRSNAVEFLSHSSERLTPARSSSEGASPEKYLVYAHHPATITAAISTSFFVNSSHSLTAWLGTPILERGASSRRFHGWKNFRPRPRLHRGKLRPRSSAFASFTPETLHDLAHPGDRPPESRSENLGTIDGGGSADNNMNASVCVSPRSPPWSSPSPRRGSPPLCPTRSRRQRRGGGLRGRRKVWPPLT
jgi:hypothetical protein